MKSRSLGLAKKISSEHKPDTDFMIKDIVKTLAKDSNKESVEKSLNDALFKLTNDIGIDKSYYNYFMIRVLKNGQKMQIPVVYHYYTYFTYFGIQTKRPIADYHTIFTKWVSEENYRKMSHEQAIDFIVDLIWNDLMDYENQFETSYHRKIFNNNRVLEILNSMI
jgi:hypothetical protein